ncbi:MAG: cation-efflux pump [Deferrisomatales bacterium]|nr:cation-efflux pump [Deferrisomatales bacterium]
MPGGGSRTGDTGGHRRGSISGEGITLGGSLINVALVLVKGAAGTVGQSAALVADALHSLSDLASDLVVLLGYRVGRRPQDPTHPYGHGKVETLSTAVVGAILVAVGLGMGSGALRSLLSPDPLPLPGRVALWAAAASLLAKEILYQWTARVARSEDSRLLLANAWHHRSDALSSAAALAGVAGARWGAPWMDPAGALVVCLFVIKVGWDLGWQATRELVDTAPDRELLERLAAAVSRVEGVRSHHDLRARRLGKDILVDVDIEVDPELSVVQGHDLARAVRQEMLQGVKGVRDAMVHVEPVGAREGGIHSPAGRWGILGAAEAIARRTPGVLGFHKTRVVPLESGYLLNIHIEVAPALALQEAHAVAHRLEEAVRALPGIVDAVVHVDIHGE